MGSFPMNIANYFYDKPLRKYLDSKTVLIYCPNLVVWIYRSPFPVDRKGGQFTCLHEDYLPSQRLEKGEGRVSTLRVGLMSKSWNTEHGIITHPPGRIKSYICHGGGGGGREEGRITQRSLDEPNLSLWKHDEKRRRLVYDKLVLSLLQFAPWGDGNQRGRQPSIG